MTLTWLLVLLAALLFGGTLLNIVLVRYLASLWRVPESTWRKATRVVLLITLVNVVGYALTFAIVVAEERWHIISEAMLAPAALVILAFVSVVVPIWALAAGLQTSLGKAAGVFVSLVVASSVIGYGLAFGFRATLAEAFVVPTGAMAPTVLGQHFRVRCPNCGSEVDVGASAATLNFVGWPYIVRDGYDCLQCGMRRIKIDDVKLLSGDRVLVDKLDRTPERFQIAVFRVLPEQLADFGAPSKTVNYVKRCVALPGEELAIFNGDLFIGGERLPKGPQELEDLWLAVHDTRFVARRIDNDWPTWLADDAAGGWELKHGLWNIDGAAPPAAELAFAGDQADNYPYDLPNDREWGEPSLVRDWRITVDVDELQGDGAIGFYWRDGKHATCLAVTSRGAVQAFRNVEHFAAAPNDDRGDDIPATARVAQISFAKRDGKAYLSIDGKVLATVDLEPARLEEARAESAAREGESRVQIGIVARGVQAQFARIQVHRDVHYRTRHEMDARMFGEEQDAWQLDREYFFLGDHSPQSQDCRFIGPIHEREIIGVARWCYWPAERMREFTGR